MTGEILDPAKLNWVGIRFLDPLGRVFRLEGDYYRAIYPDKVKYVGELFQSGIVDQLTSAGLLLPMERAPLSVRGYGLVLKTQASPWKISADTYTRRALRASGLSWISINEILLRHGLGLVDAHLGNFVLTGRCRPHWIDLGSIVPVKEAESATLEFANTILYPLELLASNRGLERVARLLLREGGASQAEHNAMLGWTRSFSPLAALAVGTGFISRASRRLLREAGWPKRRAVLRSLRRRVESINPKPARNYWTDYRSDGAIDVGTPGWTLPTEDPRTGKVVELIERVRPRRVLDIGANDGYFSALAARAGAKVLAVDSDEGAIDKFHQWIERTSLEVEAFASVDTFQRTPHKAELVVALALVHHIAITQKYKFDYIAKRFAQMSERALITEFMPNGVGRFSIAPDPLPAHYNLDIFLLELRKYFTTVDVVPYSRPGHLSPRTLIFCDGRLSQPGEAG